MGRLVIEGLDRVPGTEPGIYALHHRVHHAAIDGASGSVSYAALGDSDPDGTPALELRFEREMLGDVPGPTELLMLAAMANLLSRVRFFDTLMRHSSALMNMMGKRFSEPETGGARVPVTRFNVVLSPHKMFATTHLFADISAMRRLVAEARQ